MLLDISANDLRVLEFIKANDAFLLTEPSWRTIIYHLLPPETVNTTDVTDNKVTRYKAGESHMPIRTIEEKSAPQRLVKRGVVTSMQDYSDILNAVRDMKAGQALICDMDQAAWINVKKPETILANKLRRDFSAKGLSITAYMSGKFQVTIRKATALDEPAKRKKK